MWRVLFFLIVVFALGLGFAWLADRPGDMLITFNGYQYEVTLMVAAVIVVVIVAVVMLVWWLIKSIWNSPYTMARYFRVRRRDRGYQALSTGMIAAGAGDASLAHKKKKEAMKMISADQEPLLHLLDAQASLLEGDHDAARAKFEAMLDDPETRLLGLRGLYLEAERMGEPEAARHYASRAAEAAPQLGWAADATLEEKCAEGDWDGALKLLDAQHATRQIPREALDRRRAVLLTAKAMALLDGDPSSARTAALEANRLAPDFVPAAVTAAKAYFRHDETRKGARILEAIWKKAPHPEVAEAYVHARHGDSVQDRLTRARKLRAIKQNHPESAFTLARASLDAGDYDAARESAEASARQDPREGVFLLLADIEDAETGDEGRVRHWLAKALKAPADPAWVADGHISEHWAPVSPVTGRIDAFEWRIPVERTAPVIEQAEPRDFLPPPVHAAEPGPDMAKAAMMEDIVEAEPVAEPDAETETEKPATIKKSSAPVAPVTDPKKRDIAAPATPADAEKVATPPEKTTPTERRIMRDREPADSGSPRPPDDPGVDADEDHDPAAASRFRLF